MRAHPAVFLDRDGTLIQEANYLADPDYVELIPGAIEALTLLREAGYALVVVTNQAGIGRGYFTEAQMRTVNRRVAELKESGAPVVTMCPICLANLLKTRKELDLDGELARLAGAAISAFAARDYAQMIYDLAVRRDLFLMSDEVYREFCFDGETHRSFMNYRETEDRVVLIASISKRFSAWGAKRSAKAWTGGILRQAPVNMI